MDGHGRSEGSATNLGRFGTGRTSAGAAERATYAGRITHAAIAALVAEYEDASGIDIARVVARVLSSQAVGLSYKRSIHAAALSAAGVYWGWFRQPELRFLGAEVPLDRGRCDITWQLPSGAVLIDEVKSGVRPRFNWSLDDQLKRYAKAASAKYGKSFFGIRVCWLSAPQLSATFDARLNKIADGPEYFSLAEAGH